MSATPAQDFGERLVAVLGRRGMTRQRLAEVLDVTPETVSHWTTGRFRPRHHRLREIATALGTSVAELAGEGDEAARGPGDTSPRPAPDAIVRRLAELGRDSTLESLAALVPRLMDVLSEAQRYVDESDACGE